ILITLPVILIEAALGASLGAVIGGELKGAPAIRKVAIGTLLFAAATINIAGIVWLAGSGTTVHLVSMPARDDKPVAALTAPDPSAPGSFQVRTIFYGSGTDQRRPEYGSSVEIKTNTVDATPFLKELTGMKARLRRWYWGFGPDQFPINGRVWYPEGSGPFPLVLIVHGNHSMEEYSDPGYAYLGELLASRGMIMASVDENFLNGSWSGDLERKETAARAWILLEHLKAWRAWNGAEESPFYRKIDFEKIALIGHSRGGEAVAVASVLNRLSHYPEDGSVKLDFNYPIKSIIAIAPVDDSYNPTGKPLVPENINYLVLHGAHDADVSIFMGNRTFNRVRFTDDGYWINASLYIYRANHGQFNTVWGKSDWSSTFKALLNLKPLLDGEEQRRIAKLYISAFLEATLKGERSYLPMFRDYRAAAGWLPDTIYVSQFNDSAFRVLCDYEEDPELGTTTIEGGSVAGGGLKTWREQKIPLRAKGDFNQYNNGVYLGWEDKVEDGDSGSNSPYYRIRLPDSAAGELQIDSGTTLVFSLGNTSDKDEDPDFTIELATTEGNSAGLPFSQMADITPRLKVQFSKMGWLESLLLEPAEVVLQTYELPLTEFVKADGRFDPSRLKSITFRFDRTRSGEVVLDRVGFRSQKPEPRSQNL
ncbi:MAG TPA: alpha/beta hydrolase, partial [Blastocatellia bacterium]|nr:alpha/beta hydrolase [Blastocatellia bacterium]